MNTAQSNFNEVDLTFSTDTLPKGRSGFIGVTERGPLNRPDLLINSWPQFVKLYGGLVPGNDFPLLCKRALDGGASLRVCSVKHYSDITSPGSLTAVKSSAVVILSTGGAGKTLAKSIHNLASYTLPLEGDAIQVTEFDSDGVSNPIPILSYVATAGDALALATLVTNLVSGIDPLANYSASVGGTAVTIQIWKTVQVLPASQNGKIIKITNTTASPDVVSSIAYTLGVNGAAGTGLFNIVPKYYGAAYNELKVTTKAASNGSSDSFDMEIILGTAASTLEVYKNIKIPGDILAVDSNYLQKAIADSKLVDFVYLDLDTNDEDPIVAGFNLYTFEDGLDGDAVTVTDFIGDSNTKTGFFAFDAIDDILQLGVGFDTDSAFEGGGAVHIAGAAYADDRKDLMYWFHINNSLDTENALVAYRQSVGIDSNFTAIFAGGLRVLNPSTGETVEISELGDMFALAANSDFAFGEWYSFAGPNRGKLKNILGIVNNFGATSNTEGMDQLANAQINTVISRGNVIITAGGNITQGGKNLLWGNFTAQRSTSTLSFVNVRRLMIHLKKMLRPIVEQYLEEPNDFLTWRKIYMEVQPILNILGVKRAFYGQEGDGWQWQGDQFCDKLEDLRVNDATEVGLGKYTANLFVKDVVSLQWIVIGIVLTGSGVSFEEALTQITT